MAAFLMLVAIIAGLIVVGLLVNVYLYSQGVFKRRRVRHASQREQEQEKRITTAGLDEQFYTSIGIGPTDPVE